MKVVVSEKSPIERELEVSVDSTKLSQSWDKHMRKVISQVAIPGFRRGKAPAALVERYANREELQRSVFEEVGVPAYRAAIAQEKLAPLGDPNVQLVQFEKGKDLIFKALIEIRPEVSIDEAEYVGLEVEVPKLEVSDEDVGYVLDDFREKGTRTVTVDEERGLQENDFAVVDFEATHEGEPVNNGKSENFQMKIDDSLFVPGFSTNLHDLKVDETREFDFDFPADYRNPDLAGKKIHFKVHLKTIKVQEKPQLNDDFAQEVSRFSTLEAFKADIRERLERNLKLEAGNRAVMSMAEKKIEIPVPRAFSNNVIMQALENQARQLAQVGIKFEDFLRRQNIDPATLVERMRPNAEVSARGEMILDAIMRKLGITVSDDELKSEIRTMAEAQQRDADELEAEMKEHEHIENFRAEVARQRALAAVAEKAAWKLPVEAKEAIEATADETDADEATDTAAESTEEAAKPRKSRTKATPATEETAG